MQVMHPIADAIDTLQADGGPNSDFPNMGAGFIWPILNGLKNKLKAFLRTEPLPTDTPLEAEEKKKSKLFTCEPLAYHLYFAMFEKERLEV